MKTFNFFGRNMKMILQNENGPCPLIAIANILLIQNKISIHLDKVVITLSELIEIVANTFIENGMLPSSESRKGLQQGQLNSVLNILPNLVRGLDLNVKFSDVTAFEFTEEMSVFGKCVF
jgi:hypothetical protein